MNKKQSRWWLYYFYSSLIQWGRKRNCRDWFRDYGQRNENIWSHEDNDTPDRTDPAPGPAPDSAPTNRTSPGYTERERERDRLCPVCLLSLLNEAVSCFYQDTDSSSLQTSTESRKSTDFILHQDADDVWLRVHGRFNLTHATTL